MFWSLRVGIMRRLDRGFMVSRFCFWEWVGVDVGFKFLCGS